MIGSSPDEACHRWSLRSAFCTCSTSGQTWPRAGGQSESSQVQARDDSRLWQSKPVLYLSNTFLSPFCLLVLKRRCCGAQPLSLLLSAHQHLLPSSSPSSVPSQSAVELSLVFVSLPCSLLYRLGKLGHTEWVWRSVRTRKTLSECW